MRRHKITVRVMKRLYPHNRLTPSELSLTSDDISCILHDIDLFGGINVTYKRAEIVEEFSLSSAGRQFVEQHNYPQKIREYIVRNYKWIIGTIIALLTIVFNSCNRNVDTDEIWREKVKLSDGSHIFVYHSHNCNHDKPLFLNKEKKINFQKLKYSVFDYCVSEEDAEMLDAISRRNIAFFAEYAYDEIGSDMYFKNIKILDNTTRDFYTVYYSSSEGELIKRERPIEIFMLKDNLSTNCSSKEE